MTLYGQENFKISSIEECSYEKLDERECFYIKTLSTLTPTGYNIREGNKSSYILTDEWINLSNKELPKYISYFQYINSSTRNRIPRHGFNIYHKPSGRRKTMTVHIDEDFPPNFLEDAMKYLSIFINDYNQKINS